MSGIEVVGLVLGALPLFIEVGKAYSRGLESLRKVASGKERDEKLLNFYQEFYWEIVQIHRQIQGIIDGLPHLSDKRKAELSLNMRLDEWGPEADAAEALYDFFGSQEVFDTFLLVIGRIAQLLAELIKDSTVNISPNNLDQSSMFTKLKLFALDREIQQTHSSITERIRFWKKEKERAICLKNLETWNKRLFRLTEQARKEPLTKNSSTDSRVPSSHLRTLSQKLYKALAKRWRCACENGHRAKVCLKAQGASSIKHETAKIDPVGFDFLFSISGPQKGEYYWQEGKVLIRSSYEANKDDGALLDRICDALGRADYTCQCLQLLIENGEVDETVWQLRSLPKRLPNLELAQTESLGTVLRRSVKLTLANKRRLAVIVSHSLLQFHDSNWLRNNWNKDQIFFYCEPSGLLDFQRPYLSTEFYEDMSESNKQLDFDIFHRNPSILGLGILLIEIHTERPIESFRTKHEEATLNSNTDLLVARLFPGYRDAIQACLDTPWVPAGQRVNLEDTVTRVGVYQNIIQPLENELVYLFREKI
ncbi:hypothetical protein F5884DRAFT_823660 [Xylogone sp. PMI_703]|nr:hypothetical protein F5884DRAFT_823660 [Xylogone sp. PMI_703]